MGLRRGHCEKPVEDALPTQVPHCSGAGYAFRLGREDRVAVGFFGEGKLSRTSWKREAPQRSSLLSASSSEKKRKAFALLAAWGRTGSSARRRCERRRFSRGAKLCCDVEGQHALCLSEQWVGSKRIGSKRKSLRWPLPCVCDAAALVLRAGAGFKAEGVAETLLACGWFARERSYAISTPVKDQYAGDGIAIRGVAYGMRTVRVDGNDLFAVFTATKAAREAVLTHREPVLMEFMTYRCRALPEALRLSGGTKKPNPSKRTSSRVRSSAPQGGPPQHL